MGGIAIPSNAQGIAKGKKSERRFFEAFMARDWQQPWWYKSVRRANGLEDSEGYDFFIRTNIGQIPIQVKSSCRYIEQYWRRHPNSNAILVVVNLNDSLSVIRSATLAKVEMRWRAASVLYNGAWSMPTRTFD